MNKEVLIYRPPKVSSEGGKVTPQRFLIYEKGEITVSIFFGGIPPI